MTGRMGLARALCGALVGTAVVAHAAGPQSMHYQGRLLLGGELVSSNGVGLVLGVYDAPSGGTLLYRESDSVTLVDGLFATELGDNRDGGTQADLPTALATAGSNAWLGVTVGGKALLPRERILAAPFVLVPPAAAAPEGDPVWSNALASGFTLGGPLVLPANGLQVDTNNHQIRTAYGFVGIHTDTPATPLDVRGDLAIGGLAAQYNGAAEYLRIGGQSEHWYLGVQNEAAAGDSDFYIGLNTSEAGGILHLQHDGNVGLGTDTPRDRLHLYGPGPFLRMGNTLESEVGLRFEDAQTTSQFARLAFDASSTGFRIYVNRDDVPALTIDPQLELGIRDPLPAQPLSVQGDALIGGTGAWGDSTTEFLGIRNTQSNAWYVGIRNGEASNADFFIGKSTADFGTFTIDRQGNVGIGYADPPARLAMAGNTPDILVENWDESRAGLVMRDSGAPTTQRAAVLFDAAAGDRLVVEIGTNAALPALTVEEDAGGPRLGVGVAAPTEAFHVRGNTPNIRLENTAETEAGLVMVDHDVPDTQFGMIRYDSSSRRIEFNVNNATQSVAVMTANEFSVEGDTWIGALGAGKADGSSEFLGIRAENAAWYLGVVNDPIPTNSQLFIGQSLVPNGTFTIQTDGRVGIGTSSPRADLHLDGGNGSVKLLLAADANNNGEGDQPAIDFWQDGEIVKARIGFDVQGDNNDLKLKTAYVSSDIVFYTGTNLEDGVEQFRVDADGYVEAKVVRITGGADLSESFDVRPAASRVPTPGDVVCIDPARPGALVVSDAPYNRCVAGIISGAGGVRPGMMMGQVGSVADGEHPVALTGRVYCRADAAYGAIRPGDLLTTSTTPGHAMRVTDHTRAQGAVLGKAMTRLDEGTGLVLVLVSLQ